MLIGLYYCTVCAGGVSVHATFLQLFSYLRTEVSPATNSQAALGVNVWIHV